MTENRIHKSRAKEAFTLTEMLVVLGILGLFFGIGVPVLVSFMRQSEVEGASSMLRMAAVRARTMAIESRTKHVLVLDDEENRIWIATEEEYREYDEAGGGIDLGEVILDEPQYLASPVRLVRGRFPQAVVFAPSGGLTSGTNPHGFSLVGTTIYEGSATGGSGGTIVNSGASWQTDAFSGYCVIIMSVADSGRLELVGQRRGVASNTSDTITVNDNWDGGVNPGSGDQFAVVAPNELRNVVIYSTTGQVRVKTPPPCN